MTPKKVPAPFDSAFAKVSNLAKTFQTNEARYLSPDYQEAEARKDFIDKFFIAMGWDVNHDVQTNPYEQEVKVEQNVSMAAGQRRADYAFHLAPNFRDVCFFVEAKKPHGDIATAANYFQTIRYGWNSETPLAVLTDFEWFHILDCRYKPDPDTALNRCVGKYHYSDYSNRKKFAEIWWLFSREAVADDSLEKRAKELPKPRGKAVQRGLFPGGYQSIDESFLKELDEYRIDLAKAFKHRNPNLDSLTLTELAQRTIDRLVFLRFLEDKGIEPQRLVDNFGDKGTAWEEFIAASRRLDGIYNGIVFKQHDILDALNFRVEDSTFAGICERLSHVNSPYNFDIIPIHILGSIYERFLGKVIVATAKRVRVEEKPEVRKAGGVYYTPEYIVRYIVENTIGKLIKGKTPKRIAEMRFADIACGSGSFLLAVYDLLLIYHGNYYNRHPGKARKGDCIKHGGKLYLSLAKKREILLNNIYGVDIDAQAVEVCQLSLYLKLLQDETTTSARQYMLDFEHVAKLKKLLPDLSKNIVRGNSLIGTDILDSQLFTRDEECKLNPMNFKDAFPEVTKRGGFDAIVGNPPYRKERDSREFIADIKKSGFGRQYYEGKMDLWYFFLHRAIELTKPTGLISFIVPSYWLKSAGATKLRQHIRDKCMFVDAVDFAKNKIFDNVGGMHMTFALAIEKQDAKVSYQRFTASGLDATEIAQVLLEKCCKRSKILAVDEAKIHTTEGEIDFGRGPFLAFLDKLDKNTFLLEDASGAFEVSQGIVEAPDSVSRSAAEKANKLELVGKGVFVLPQAGIRRHKFNERECRFIKHYLRAADVRRYHWEHAGFSVLYIGNEGNKEIQSAPRLYANIRDHLDTYKAFITSSNRPYGIHRTRESRFFTRENLLCPNMFDRPTFAYCGDEYYVNFAFNIVIAGHTSYSLKYLLGLLNSRLGAIWFDINGKKRGVNNDVGVAVMRRFPVRCINFSNATDKARHDEIVQKVEAMLEAKKQLAVSKTDKDKTYYENKCAGLDRQIDRLVYDLYGLTEEDIKIVEGGERSGQV